LSFQSSARAEAPQLALTVQGDGGPVFGDQAAPAGAAATGDSTDDKADTAPTEAVDPTTAAADAAEPTSDADIGIPSASPQATAPQAGVPQAANDPSVTTSQAIAASPNPMGCRPGEVFTDMQDWWN